MVTHVPQGIEVGDEFIVRARVGLPPTDAAASKRLVRLIERLLGGRGARGRSRDERDAFEAQMGQIIDMLRDAKGDKTKGMAVEKILLDLFGEDTSSDDDDDDDSSSEASVEDDASDHDGEAVATEPQPQEEESEEESSDEEGGDESSDDSDSSDDGDSRTIEVVVPHGVRGGDVIQVRVPASAGGGLVAAAVPHGLGEGDVFDIDV